MRNITSVTQLWQNTVIQINQSEKLLRILNTGDDFVLKVKAINEASFSQTLQGSFC